MIHHVNFPVTREQAEACAEFYGLLGFVRVDPGESLRDRGIWVEHGGTQLHLEYLARDGTPLTAAESGPIGHIALVVDDFEAACTRLAEAGVSLEEHPPYWGSPRVVATDPAGHIVELMAWPPKPADC